MRNKIVRVIAIVFVIVFTMSILAACGDNISNNGDSSRTNIMFLYKSNSDSQEAWMELIKAYNDGQGKIDGVYVNGKFSTSYATTNNFTASQKSAYNVVMVNDTQNTGMSSLAIKRDTKRAPNGYMVNLQPYADADADFQKNTINEDALNWWRMTYNANAKQGSGAEKHIIGEGQDLLGVPVGVQTQVNLYSTTAFEAVGINIVSVPENELDAYNQANGTSLKAHGYAEYKNAPVSGMKASQNLAGETVYKVFNNCISMNWEEQRNVLKYFTKAWNSSAPTDYGFVSEYWFSYGWSVGGDVMGFNGTDYDFTLTDDRDNYMVVEDGVTIHNHTYNKGDIVLYEDRVNATNLESLLSEGKIYAIASQYEAVKEYLSMNVDKTKLVDTNNGVSYYGYQVANPDTGNSENYLTNGTVAMIRTTYETYNKYASSQYSWINLCPCEQYREYEGGSTYQKDGKSGFDNEYLKVIGETYDGEVYTGDIKTVNGVKILGDQSAAGSTAALVIPACSDPEKYQAAWDFISWVATDGQKYIAKTTTLAPVANDVIFSDDFVNNADIAKGKNLYAIALNSSTMQRGDWGYFESGQWVTDWANDFNFNVRYGKITIAQFTEAHRDDAENSLNNMYCIIKGIR